MKTKTLIVRITEDLKKDFEKAANKVRRSQADFHRVLLEDGIKTVLNEKSGKNM